MKQFRWILIGLLLIGGVVAAQDDMDDMMNTPTVEVADQLSLDGSVSIDTVVSDGPGFVVIHADNGEGAPGPVIGFRAINDGMSTNVSIDIDPMGATPTLFAMLHRDDNEVGVYEFGQVEGADGPVAVDGAVVTPSFTVELVRAYDQYADMGTVAIASVVTQQDGWLVIHAENAETGGPGPVIGFAAVSEGANTDVVVEVDTDMLSATLFPMLHVDTGEAGEYEFGAVEGADGPVVVDGQVATFPITVNQATMRVDDQIVTDTVVAEQVSVESAGWLVIHADSGEGSPGPVIGFAPLEAGVNLDVTVEVDPEGVTPDVWPMLHVDTGEAGVYEFGQVEGADGPITVDGNVVTFPINAAPDVVYEGSLDGSTLTIDSALIDTQGWMVVHADSGEGSPGPVIGFTPLVSGLTTDIVVELDEEGITETVFPMLHVDTGEAGVYEFGQVEGADGPVRVADAVVTGPLTPDTMDME